MSAELFVETLVVSPFQMNCSVIACPTTKKAAIVDPGDEPERVLAVVEREGFEVTHILLTHAHVDHAGAAGAIKAVTGAPIVMHREDLPLYEKVPMQAQMFGLASMTELPPPDRYVEEGDTVTVGELEFDVLHTPGHSPGSVCYYLKGGDGHIFVGDVLFAGSIGRTDLWGGDYATLMRSIGQKLMALPDTTKVYAGHMQTTTIGHERNTNMFRRDFIS